MRAPPSGDVIRRYDRGASMLPDLGDEPFPDISRAVSELAEIAGPLATERWATKTRQRNP